MPVGVKADVPLSGLSTLRRGRRAQGRELLLRCALRAVGVATRGRPLVDASVERNDAIALSRLAPIGDRRPAAVHHDLADVMAQLDTLAARQAFPNEPFDRRGQA